MTAASANRCPECRGIGWIAPPDFPPGAPTSSCTLCDARGTLTDGQMKYVEEGAAFKRARLSCGLTLRRAAAAFSMNPNLLSLMERGARPLWPELRDFALKNSKPTPPAPAGQPQGGSTMFLAAFVACSLVAQQPTVAVSRDDGPVVTRFGETTIVASNLTERERLAVDIAAFAGRDVEEFGEWLELVGDGGSGGGGGAASPLAACVSQASSTCGNGNVCWVQFTGSSGGAAGSCAFGCAVKGAVPPCSPAPSVTPAPTAAE